LHTLDRIQTRNGKSVLFRTDICIEDMTVENIAFFADRDLVHMSTSDSIFFNKILIFVFQKILKINLYIVNVVFRIRVKYQLQIVYILSYTEMTKM
jgi:hypothetical protein